jgi:hypothetical protein
MLVVIEPIIQKASFGMRTKPLCFISITMSRKVFCFLLGKQYADSCCQHIDRFDVTNTYIWHLDFLHKDKQE